MGMSRSDSSFLHPPRSMSGSPRPCPKGPGPPQRAHSFGERMPGGVQTIVDLQDALPLAESPLLKTPDTPERSIYPIITKAASAAAVRSQPMVRQYPSPTPCKPLPLPTLTSVRPVLCRRRSSETGEQQREAEKVVAVANVRQANDRRVLLELDITDSNNTRSIHHLTNESKRFQHDTRPPQLHNSTRLPSPDPLISVISSFRPPPMSRPRNGEQHE